MNNLIYNVEPFNNFSLGTCFYDAYLPAFIYFGGNDTEFVLNQNTKFVFKDNLQVTSYEIKIKKLIEANYGIESIMHIHQKNNLIEYVIDNLDKKHLIICRTLGTRAFDPKTNKKTDTSTTYHWLLIFGYDKKKKEFDILEHWTNVASHYYKLKIKFNELNIGYQKTFEEENVAESLYEIWNDNKSLIVKEDLVLICNFIKEHQNEIKISCDSLVKYFNSLIASIDEFDQKGVMIITETVKYFLKQSYLMNKISYDTCIEKLLNELNLLRAYYIKTMRFKTEKNKEKLELLSNNLTKITSDFYNDYIKLGEK